MYHGKPIACIDRMNHRTYLPVARLLCGVLTQQVGGWRVYLSIHSIEETGAITEKARPVRACMGVCGCVRVDTPK